MEDVNQKSIELWTKSKVLTSKLEPCQIALAKRQCKNKWSIDSSSLLHIRQRLEILIPFVFSISKIGRLPCKIFQIKVKIL